MTPKYHPLEDHNIYLVDGPGINDSSLRNKLGKQARKWVKEERDWPILAKKITNLYDSLTNKTG